MRFNPRSMHNAFVLPSPRLGALTARSLMLDNSSRFMRDEDAAGFSPSHNWICACYACRVERARRDQERA